MLEIDVYGAGLCFPEFEKQFEAIEAALGFKLFVWQKTYIATGNFRRYGATTAQILRELMQVDAFPLDYSIKPTTQREAWYRGFLREIKQQLDAAGVPTREVNRKYLLYRRRLNRQQWEAVYREYRKAQHPERAEAWEKKCQEAAAEALRCVRLLIGE